MSKITKKKINDVAVNAIPVTKVDLSKVKGCDLFPELYANIFLIAKKKSGKSNVIAHILKNCVGKNTTVVIFASTFYRDDVWKAIEKWLKENKIEYIAYTSIYEDKDNHVKDLTQYLESSDDTEVKADKNFIFDFNDPDKKEEEKPKKEKKVSPEYIIVFDDTSKELQDKFVGYLLKRNRHFKTKVIVSTQYLNDLAKDARLQMDYLLLFPKLPNEKIDEIYKMTDLSIDYNLFLKLYKDATKDKFNFLYVDTKNEIFRHNFNKQYNLPGD
jgi:hypothetical protein